MNGTGTLHFYTDDYRFNAVYVTPIIIIKNKYKSIQRMAKNTALFKENWDMGKAIPTLKDLLDKQVIDNRKQIEHGKG